MKRRIALTFLGALLLLACTRETPVSPVMEPEIHTIRAGFAVRSGPGLPGTIR